MTKKFIYGILLLTLCLAACGDQENLVESSDLVTQRSLTTAHDECGLLISDLQNKPLCISTTEARLIPVSGPNNPFGSVLVGYCTNVRVEYSYIACYSGGILIGNGNLTDLVITDIEIDWDWLVNNCPDLPLPTSPSAQIDFFEEIRKAFAWRLEQIVLVELLIAAPNGNCEDGDTEPISVTRVEASCFTYCEVVGQSSTASRPIVARKTKCNGNKCCQLEKKYCITERNPNNNVPSLNVLKEKVVSLGTDCDSPNCDGQASQVGNGCDNGCDDIFF